MICTVTLDTGVELTVDALIWRDDSKRPYVEDYRVIACMGKPVRRNVKLSYKADTDVINKIEGNLS